jgi:hypothetical protein
MINLNLMKNLPTILVNAVLLFSVVTPLASANEGFHNDDANLYESSKFALGAGFGIVRFDTNVKVTDKTSGDTSFIDVDYLF